MRATWVCGLALIETMGMMIYSQPMNVILMDNEGEMSDVYSESCIFCSTWRDVVAYRQLCLLFAMLVRVRQKQ